MQLGANPILGTAIHAIGGVSASTCYLPFQKIETWSWGSYWLLQASFAWFIFPVIIGFLTVPELLLVFQRSSDLVIWSTFSLGIIYGFGGLSFGLAIKEIGYSLTYTISIGISAILSTLIPLILKGTLMTEFAKPGGGVLLVGMFLSLIGISLCGYAGHKKEQDLKSQALNKDNFNSKKGLILTIVAGVLSAVFGISLSVGEPMAVLASEAGAGMFKGNAGLILSTGGAFLTNLIWFGYSGIKEGTIKELMPIRKGGNRIWFKNVLLSVLSGGLWYFQFFFYGLGHVNMGEFMFASWVIHMSMLVFFSFIVGLVLKEWEQVSRFTYLKLLIGLGILILSFIVMTIGSLLGNNN